MHRIAKLFAKSTSASVVNIVCGLINAKIFATLIGASGAGFLGQVLMITSTVTSLSILFGSTALIQGASARDKEEKTAFLLNVRNLWLICWLFVNVVSLVCVVFISSFMFADVSTVSVLVTAIATLASLLNVLATFGASVQYSDGEIGLVARQSVITGVSGVLLSACAALLIKNDQVVAGVALIVMSQFVAVVLVLKYLRLRYRALVSWSSQWFVNFEILRNYFKMTSASFVSTALNMAFFLYIRHLITHSHGIKSLGIFDFSYKISMQYVGLVLSGFASYYIPSFAKLQDNESKNKMTSDMLDFVLCLSIPMIVCAITFKSLAIDILATSEYYAGIAMISWMMIGDYFKIISWQFSGTAIALGDSKAILVLECLWYVPMIAGLVFCGTQQVDLWFGACFLAAYILNLVAGIIYARKKFAFKFKFNQCFIFGLGFFLIVLSSFLTWKKSYMTLQSVILCLIVVVGFCVYAYKNYKRSKLPC